MTTVILGAASVTVLVAVLTGAARRLGLGLTETEGVLDVVDGWLYGGLGLPRSPRSVIAQLRRQAARAHTGLTAAKVLAPAGLRFSLHPAEHALLDQYERHPFDVVAGAAQHSARRHGWLPDARPEVELRPDPVVRRGRPLLEARYGGTPDPVATHNRSGGGTWVSPGTKDVDRAHRLGTGAVGDTTVGLASRKAGSAASVRLVVPAPDRALSASSPAAVELSEATPAVVIGRGSGADLQVRGTGVSRAHTRVTWRAGRAYVEDLGSTNGTWVDGARLTIPRLLTHSTVLRLGEHGPEVQAWVSGEQSGGGEVSP